MRGLSKSKGLATQLLEFGMTNPLLKTTLIRRMMNLRRFPGRIISSRYMSCITKDVTMADEFEVKIRKKSEAEKDLEDASDKVKAGAKAVANKVREAGRDLELEYRKEKLKEKID
jgi:hypothetical protein